MAFYSYKRVRDLLPPYIIEAMGPEYEGNADYDGDQWDAAAMYIESLLTQLNAAKNKIKELEMKND